MEQIKKKLANLKQEVEEAYTRADESKEKMRVVENQNEALLSEVESYKRKVNLLEDTLDHTEERLADARKKMLEVPPPSPRENSHNDDEKEKLQDTIDDWKMRFREMETKFEEKERECISMKAQVERLERDLEMSEEKYEKNKNELEQTLAELGEL